mgnify:FL=1
MNEKTYLNHLLNIRKLYYEDTDKHLQFYNALLDAQLFLLLNEEPQEDELLPQIKDIESNRYVLVFENEDRLVDFCGNVAPYAAVSGRVLIEMLEGQEIGLAFNLNAKAAEALLPKDVVEWLSEVIRQVPEMYHAKPKAFFPLDQKAERTLVVLHEKLATVASLAKSFFLSGVEYDDATRGILLAIIDADVSAEPILSKMAHEAVAFGGIQDAVFDVVFLKKNDQALASIEKQAIKLQLTKVEPKTHVQRHIPGADPDKPPKLL